MALEGFPILPGTGRGTVPAQAGMVEGATPQASRPVQSPLHQAAPRFGPPPRSGEE